MGLRVGLAALVATAVIAPLAAGSSAAVSATGVVSGSGTEYTIAVHNNGDQSIICMQFFPSGVNVIEATGPGSTGLRGGGGFGSGGFVLLQGDTATWKFTTDKAMAPNAGGKLHVSGDCSEDTIVDASGPAAPPPPPPACNCLTLTARILPKSIAFTNPGETDGMFLEFAVHWTMSCTAGSGGCKGTLDVAPPKGRTYKSHFKKPGSHIDCAADCAKLVEGTKKFVLIGNRGLGGDRRGTKVKSIPIKIKRTCQGKALRPIALKLVFDKSTALVDKKKSKLR